LPPPGRLGRKLAAFLSIFRAFPFWALLRMGIPEIFGAVRC